MLFDANVWYSRTLTDWFLQLFQVSISDGTPAFYPQWTEDILAEARYNLRRSKPYAPSGALDARFDKIRTGLSDWRIKDYAVFTSHHPDANDHHVLGAALAGHTDYLVTNDKGFSHQSQNYPFSVLTPENFLCLLWDTAPELCTTVTRRNLAYWQRRNATDPAVSVDIPGQLSQADCPQFAKQIALLLRSMQDGSMLPPDETSH